MYLYIVNKYTTCNTSIGQSSTEKFSRTAVSRITLAALPDSVAAFSTSCLSTTRWEWHMWHFSYLGEEGRRNGYSIDTLQDVEWISSTEETLLCSLVSWFQGLKSTQTWHLGQQNVSHLLRCPHWVERFYIHWRRYSQQGNEGHPPYDCSTSIFCLPHSPFLLANVDISAPLSWGVC